MKKIKYQRFTISILLLSIFFAISTIPTNARTISEIESEIKQKQQELTEVNTTIAELEENIIKQKAEMENVVGRRNTLRAELALNANQKSLIEEELRDLNKNEILTKLEQEKRILTQDRLVSEAYVTWRQMNTFRILLQTNSEDIVKISTYQNSVSEREQKNIEQLETELEAIQKELNENEIKKAQYQAEIDKIDAQVKVTERLLAELDSKILANQNDVANYRGRLGSIQSAIDELTAEQKRILEAESVFLGKVSNGGTKTIKQGQIYFQGIGREAYQGHGVGMSQFGALGAALAGWDAEKIVEFYYPGAEVETYGKGKKISVEGYGSMDIEDYVAGAGEVPDHSCEELDLKFDSKNVWQCWPEEAIKAQAIAFRTYGIHSTISGGTICTSAKCQVYKGGTNKKWAAEATEGRVIMYDNEPIAAFYSSDNHNGWGNGNNDTVWSSMSGVGEPKKYLRAVNDKKIAFHYTYTDWGWRTNGYSISDVDKMLTWSVNSEKSTSGYKEFLKTIKTKVGTLKGMDFERDPSGRVKRVKLIGEKGGEYIAGWLFKSAWNIWVGNEMPSGEKDFIYSLTYYMRVG